jgi:hypothetical protein
MLNATYLEWDLIGSASELNAQTIQRHLDNLRLVDCHCDPCHGVHSSKRAGTTDQDKGAVPVVSRGS